MWRILLTLTLLTSLVWAASKEKSMYKNIMEMPDTCVKAPPVQNNYSLTGTEFVLKNEAIPDILIYETLDKTSTKIVIAAYDIFGFSDNNTRQVADIIAKELNVTIVMPDYFRGTVFTPENPNPTKEEIARFVSVRGDWEDSVYPDTLAVIDYYKRTANATSFGFFGWCWGGKIATLAATHIEDLNVVGLIHPGNVELQEASEVKCPMYLMPGSDDVDMLPFYEVLVENFGILNTGHRRFDLPHGFAGGRSDFSDPATLEAVDEVITIITEFFASRLV